MKVVLFVALHLHVNKFQNHMKTHLFSKAPNTPYNKVSAYHGHNYLSLLASPKTKHFTKDGI